MNILLLNGSPRLRGNTTLLLEEFSRGAADAGHRIESVRLDGLRIAPCRGCYACRSNGGVCVQKDDQAALLDRLRAADLLVLGTPVYFWGMSAQTKLFIDRLYADMDGIRGKKLGCVISGGSPLDNPQYRLITEQLGCIAAYLDWDIVFMESVFAWEAGEVAGQPELLKKLRRLGAEAGVLRTAEQCRG